MIYLVCAQRPDAVSRRILDRRPALLDGIQLDEVSFPIMLAWAPLPADALKDFDPYPMVLWRRVFSDRERARDAPGSGRECRLFALDARAIHGADCAACFARDRGDLVTAQFLEE